MNAEYSKALFKRIWTGFVFAAVLIFFTLANLYSYVRTPTFGDQAFRVGFPVPFYEIAGTTGASSYSVAALCLDIICAIGVAYLAAQFVGWLCRDQQQIE